MKIHIEAHKAIQVLYNLMHGIDGAIEDALDELSEFTKTEAASRTKGQLAKSIKIKSSSKAREIFADKPYAEYVENGRGEIFAKEGSHLIFTIGGRKIFTKHVRATKPQPFLMPAGELMKKEIQKVFAKHIKRVNQDIDVGGGE